uniref:Uncharacterized protein n=1 Tax=Chlamydomonas leiostraca TaxID=1034604 RepID=A0A7S0WRG6_9CHLO|mmetsp:Transcript_2403/g.6071  ORF Transcript_2403/g.6071 Transcript_2403/m.6071 type:complete len:735 (+) Transcript_2403:95-2299(+)|eukprot:CAMPEP_0202858330 /NCGR_PEP_ID=MMETSP1391-20130828/912_1 /ASSEMBLY_ACC=CAM_ASM_000867 /TAXON_ID=1034604 /ORGANISM="Chlamydomonas leiostraca, Strain SAG 11-49" /LENGTH=734 /DNA_ID=CAMNT_0049537241 /DNA_START=91 /DNA_END=2295 /DNA_ORIENTATION=+
MFWKVAGFSAPSPIEQLLDKEEFTLEELLDEDDLIQECKSLNGRLVAFLRERSTVEQLVRYLVEPALDADDPKRTYKYPFTACEVFCCEVEAVFNTLLEDAELMQLLFSLLDQPAPLSTSSSSKTAGYFGRVVGNLLLRKTNEMMQYLQENIGLLEKLVAHVDTTSIADIIKRLVGADEQSSILFLPQYAQWLADTNLVELLLAKLAEGSSADAQANAADILSAVAHTQPSPLASTLTTDESIAALFSHAMAPSKHVLVPSLDVCIALVEPRRSAQVMDEPPMQDAFFKAKSEAVVAIVQHLPKLVELLNADSQGPAALVVPPPHETPYGTLAPPLGRARLKVVELLAVLLRSGSSTAEAAIMQAGVVPLCLQLFAQYPFNNILHHCVLAMLVAGLTKSSDSMLQHLFEQCKLLDWLISLPVDVRPMPRAGHEEAAASKSPLRAGYLGHVTQIACTLESFSSQATSSSSSDAAAPEATKSAVATYLEAHEGWHKYLEEQLHPRLEIENTSRWACGRPTATELVGLDSDGDEFQAEMELEHMVGMQPALYHRYNVDENDDDDDDDNHDENDENDHFKNTYGAQMITDAISNIDLNDTSPWHNPQVHEEISQEDEDKPGASTSGVQGGEAAAGGAQGMEDDEVLLATSDDDELLSGGGPEAMGGVSSNGPSTEAQGGSGSHPITGMEDDMQEHDEDMPEVASPQPAAGMAAGAGGEEAGKSPAAKDLGSMWQGQSS